MHDAHNLFEYEGADMAIEDCPDCNENGGEGPRCLEHDKEHTKYEIRCLQQHLKELEEKIPMKFGLYTICEFSDEAPEPEGTVIYDKLPPDIGTEVMLSDKEIWVVVRVEEYNSTVYVQLKDEKKEKSNED